MVEKRERDRQAEQRDQVQVQQRPGAALAATARKTPATPGQERRDEHHAQREPDVPGVHAPTERPRVATRHRPRHLEAGPDLGDGTGGVVDVDLSQLGLVLARREPAHLPLARPLRVFVRDRVPVVAQLGLDRQRRRGDRLDLGRGEPVPLGRHVLLCDEHRRIRVRRRGRRDRGGGRDGGGGASWRRRGEPPRREHPREEQRYEERCELWATPIYARKLQSFCPMNDSGVPAAIAIACAATFIRPASTSNTSTT